MHNALREGGSMGSKVKNIGLVAVGVLTGALITFQLSAVAQRESRPALPYDEIRQFTDVYGKIKSDYVDPVDDKKLVAEAITGMLAGLDPHSAYLDADAFKDLQVGTRGEFGGLGMEIGAEEGFPKVIAPIEDTPAARAGVRAGDLIVRIDDKSTKGMTTTDAVKLLRGEPRTSVTLTLMRKNVTTPIVVTLERAVIKVQSVRSKFVEPGIAYVRVSQFLDQTAENLAQQLTKMAAPPNQIKGIVLDLRNDPGGVLHGAIGVAAAFLPPRALVVSTDGRTDDARRKYVAAPEDYVRSRSNEDFLRALPPEVRKVPMIVLVNSGSASASEIVAGALQDHKRATILGTQTFGKGSVQTILPLSHTTAIKLTTARYYTPSGRSIQAKGIEPDLLVDEYKDGDPFSEFRQREADLDHHLTNAQGEDPSAKRTPEQRAADMKRLEDLLAKRKPVEFGGTDDWQLQQALNQLHGRPVELAKPKGETTAARTPPPTDTPK